MTCLKIISARLARVLAIVVLSIGFSFVVSSGALAQTEDQDLARFEPVLEVGFCASSPTDLVRESPSVIIFRDAADQLRVSVDSEVSSPAVAVRRKEAHYSVQAKNVRLELAGLRLSLIDGVRYLIFDARARTKKTDGRFVNLACRVLADRLRATDI